MSKSISAVIPPPTQFGLCLVEVRNRKGAESGLAMPKRKSVVSGTFSISHDDQDGIGGHFGCNAQVGHISGW